MIFIVIIAVYIAFMGYLVWGLGHIRPFVKTKVVPQTTFTIVVPFRNENENLPLLLESFEALDYPKNLYEIILIDDASNDGFELPQTLLPIRIIKQSVKSTSPKKEAITTAIAHAHHNWMVTTDADCKVSKNWLQVLDNYIQHNSPEMVVAPVMYPVEKTFVSEFQRTENLVLQGVTMGSFGVNQAFMCNGANFAYKKSVFVALNGFVGNENIAGGDDVFLLQKAIVKGVLVAYLNHVDAIVYTQAQKSWVQLLEQKVRWAAKTHAYTQVFAKLLAVIILLGNMSLIAVLLTQNFGLILALWAVKLGTDFLFLYLSSQYFKQPLPYLYFGIGALLYPFWSIVIAIRSFKKTYRWKGRKY